MRQRRSSADQSSSVATPRSAAAATRARGTAEVIDGRGARGHRPPRAMAGPDRGSVAPDIGSTPRELHDDVMRTSSSAALLAYYLRSPQPGGRPVDVGGRPYDNARHTDWDLFVTFGIGVNL
jgi:hypothetical protein